MTLCPRISRLERLLLVLQAVFKVVRKYEVWELLKQKKKHT
jgi:hypothetical protein